MYFYDFNEMPSEYVTPKYSTAYGPVLEGEHLEAALLRFKANEGAVEHAHPPEQIMYVISGKLRVRFLDGLPKQGARLDAGQCVGGGVGVSEYESVVLPQLVDMDAHGRGVDDAAEAFLASTQRLLGLLSCQGQHVR